MAAKALDKALSDKIIAEWRTGAYSQQKLADKHSVSKGAVNKLCKGVNQDVTDIVTAGTLYKSGLAQYDDRIVTAINEVVEDKTRSIIRYNSYQDRLAAIGMKMIEQKLDEDGNPIDINPMELTAVSRVVKDSREGVVGKSPDTAIQFNNNISQSNIMAELIAETTGKVLRPS